MEIAKLKNYNPINNTRKCKKCENWIDLSNFSTRICKGKENLQVREICKDCSVKFIKNNNLYSNSEYRKLLYRRNITKHLLKNAKVRSKNKNLDFNLNIEDIIIPEICPLLKIPIIISENKVSDNSPNLDRINNNKGYIKGNVWIISKKANTIKNNATIQEIELLLNNLRVLYKLGEFSEQPEVVNTDLSINLND